jgi:hypothetical protein
LALLPVALYLCVFNVANVGGDEIHSNPPSKLPSYLSTTDPNLPFSPTSLTLTLRAALPHTTRKPLTTWYSSFKSVEHLMSPGGIQKNPIRSYLQFANSYVFLHLLLLQVYHLERQWELNSTLYLNQGCPNRAIPLNYKEGNRFRKSLEV